MSSKIKVVVSGVGGDVAQGVVKALKKSTLNLEIYKICAYHNSSWLHCDDLSFIAPLTASSEYISYLKNLIRSLEIDVFFPCVDSEIFKMSKNKEKIENETNAIVCIDNFDKVNICNDKYETFKFLKSNNFYCPQTIVPNRIEDIKKIIHEVGFPLIVKKKNRKWLKAC